MSPSNQTFRGSAALEQPTDPTIYNLDVTLANTEYSQALSANTKKISIACRGTAKLQVAFASGDSGVLYFTIPRGARREIDGVNFTGAVYLQASEDAQVVEILEWT